MWFFFQVYTQGPRGDGATIRQTTSGPKKTTILLMKLSEAWNTDFEDEIIRHIRMQFNICLTLEIASYA